MNRATGIRTGCTVAGAIAASFLLSGCISSPTYGTDKTANAQLIDDLSNIVSIKPPKRNSEVAYAPRPAIVKPPEEGGTALPAPQTSLASKDNPQWPESPEETRQRLRQEAEDARGSYRSPLATGSGAVTAEQREQFRQAKALQKGTYSGRRFLSDPPVEYRQPAETAPVDDLGEPEYKKERARKRAAQKEKGWKIGNLWPF
ncbi:hypothetical protein [Nitratireductor sp. XY-223]|uniref:hypothetical protein n=1 Tax=Nitratireductor sp. XY-223 TaxID=2561926 RepID=UPI00145B0EB4|nr:hypothetical protein [Nitratireductor sp. XY-223]